MCSKFVIKWSLRYAKCDTTSTSIRHSTQTNDSSGFCFRLVTILQVKSEKNVQISIKLGNQVLTKFTRPNYRPAF